MIHQTGYSPDDGPADYGDRSADDSPNRPSHVSREATVLLHGMEVRASQKPLVDLPLPVWEHGHRCHGYWIENRRVGFVGLTPPGYQPVVYSWSLDDAPEEKGECKSLKAAKRRVEAAFRRAYSWRFPASR